MCVCVPRRRPLSPPSRRPPTAPLPVDGRTFRRGTEEDPTERTFPPLKREPLSEISPPPHQTRKGILCSGLGGGGAVTDKRGVSWGKEGAWGILVVETPSARSRTRESLDEEKEVGEWSDGVRQFRK